ncbi:hypothetical protein Athai_19420 [Actinocatenispora thailandica]|uniref:DUF1707 domain-containing protein n=1 Tax=Actinocatenispora thailandica TaxID=227318 RepID=A0A7R7DMI8_9ACTN|nr:DUF1707 domain-containing protein [Actinocatenispora thailandica]BCJ34439.1 hypothetical protein Athai_19420 [Actinocatenispora thailandica]
MQLGWRDGGYGDLRASNEDRAAVRRVLRIAEGEGRLDAAEYDRRLRAVDTAETRAGLAELTTDLPVRRGEREWDDRARVRTADRDTAIAVLARGSRDGRLSAREYERRIAAVPEVVRYADLAQLLAGLPGWPGAPDTLLAGDTDREVALAALAEAVAEGKVGAVELPALDAEIAQARWCSDLTTITDRLAKRVGDRARAAVVDELDAAYQAGQLDAREQADRVTRARRASSPAQLARLVRDLAGADRRPSDADRAKTTSALARGLQTGRLTLTEYDRRLVAAAEATGTAALRELVADLVEAPRRVRRTPLDMLFDALILNSALIPLPRYRWLTWLVKPLFGLLAAAVTTAVVGIEAAALVTGEWGFAVGFLLLGFVVGMLPVTVCFLLLRALLRRLFGRGEADREQTILHQVRSALQERRDVREATVNWDFPALDIEIDGVADRREVAEEAVRLLWPTRLYPLRAVRVRDWSSSHDERPVQVRLDRARRRHLRDTYGPRPYGPLPRWEDERPPGGTTGRDRRQASS